MKLNKNVIEGALVLGLAAVLTITSVTTGETSASTIADSNVAVSTSLENEELAGGASATIEKYQVTAAADLANNISVAQELVDLVTATQEEVSDGAAVESEQPVELTEEEKEWQDKLMAKVDESLNVRKEADENSELVGKLLKGSRAQIISVGDTWTEIESGNVKGFVKNEFCVTGSEALAYAKETVETVAKVNIDGLRIRSEASQDGDVINGVSTGTTLIVNTKAEAVDGWVAVIYKSVKGYVSADYVTVSLNTTKGITVEEEAAAKKAAAEKAAAAASSSSSTASAPKTETGSSVAASTDDLTLLAAIIQCEAGGESYQTQLGIGAVVCNRVKSKSYPGSIYKVIYQRGQFGPASSGKLARVLKNGSISSSCKKAAKAALSGQDNTKGAIGFRYYSKGAKGVKIGRLLFFK